VTRKRHRENCRLELLSQRITLYPFIKGTYYFLFSEDMTASANKALLRKNRGQGIFSAPRRMKKLTAEEKAVIAKVLKDY